ncbi:hypothetical protein ABZ770_07630 [Streptomyces sp. NPDC006654]|uniref:hypothetical protein n=1 Tax=Streptomyces sp. NPDC006654 TaxID=3156897 RepID=UPI00340D47B9
MNALVEADDRQGGHSELERAAAAGRDGVLELQHRNAGEHVRRALYALAAEYTTIAACPASTPATEPLRSAWTHGRERAGRRLVWIGHVCRTKWVGGSPLLVPHEDLRKRWRSGKWCVSDA